MKSKVITNRRNISFLTDVSLDVEEVLDALSRIDYDYLTEEMVKRNLIEPPQEVLHKTSQSSVLEDDYLRALNKLRNAYYLLDEESINRITQLYRKL